MIFYENDTIDPLGVPVRLLKSKEQRALLRKQSRLVVEDRTSNYIRYRAGRTRYGYWKNQAENKD